MELNTVREMRSEPIEPVVFKSPAVSQTTGEKDMFGKVLDSVIGNINTTNGYLSQAENEEIKLSLGKAENTHDLAIALQKASTALQYTVAVRDRFLEAYKELMNMQF
ncbi:MAG: flagellar hook-basal body complex protein FliE [Lachnospiraceae bacterium]|nr:flagellar hook-basal body complex protein FliE [Lachnospiraceae bacterium]